MNLKNNDSISKSIEAEFERNINTPMIKGSYIGKVEMMSRMPARYDYLYEAAFADCYAKHQEIQDQKNIVQIKAKAYYQLWKTGPQYYYDHNPEHANIMILKYKEILRRYPDHPMKNDLFSAINELQKSK